MVAGTIASNRDAVQNQGAVVTDGRSLPRSASGHSGSMTCSSAAAQSASLISLNSPAACCISPSSRRVDDRTNRPDGRPSRALVLRRSRPPVLRGRGGHSPRRADGPCAAAASTSAAGATHAVMKACGAVRQPPVDLKRQPPLGPFDPSRSTLLHSHPAARPGLREMPST